MSDQEVKIPEDLHNIVQNSIQTGLTRRKARQRQNHLTAISAAAVCCTFLFFFQTNAVFAKTVMDLPIVSHIARLFLASDSQTEEISYIADIKIPQLENNDQAEALNTMIAEQIQAHEASAKQRAKEEYQAIIQTGGDEADYIPARISIDYQLYCNNDQYLSFAILFTYVRAQSSQTVDCYNVEAGTGRTLTLVDLAGTDYQQRIAQEIQRQIQAKPEAEQAVYNDDLDWISLIGPERLFHLDHNGNLIIEFEKYEIAVGAAGVQTFTIALDRLQ
ncbi:DUF3298 and DUF4163 domain-containing protein [Holdemania massiliensis]|uniref:DUF3298 domain-containing protein n=1 Tax=Holdemania massiliensis TaxID=1468449 RepID=A0A6N7S3C9_9FIRM|nr:DUF3298 and DUF4163 domain-containing protein [Holdemania massiliensis]MSA70287.1 DUF3298 domain-containing protein [Holdemania massiliensis]MSA88182.1 DUF3298 domain-containing protein [Holdemania massiliensis]MSB77011.1 DUF3298 domain-containing protein [Holdemania massiliensis]MSC31937.1 DUF3298 domain-containing protein [Holdemania massiliensis]MSC38257.1 DUF3298 domain-containing protein [Holdemania massiliensis]